MKLLLTAAVIFPLAKSVLALDGQPGIHDPSTIGVCDAKYYTYGTGGSSLVSDDGWTWRQAVRPPRTGMAPDIIHIGDRYFVYTAGNPGGQPHGAVNMASTKSLDPNSPDYNWEQGGVVASSDGVEDCNAIDPGALLDPADGKLWLTYGSYFGFIRQVQLDPKTGKRVDPNDTPYNLAINCEASDMIYHDGWYYLLATHGSCCRGSDSGYNIRMGRSRSVHGPFLDHDGVDMIQGGGKLFLGSGGRVVGPGHFGLLDLGDGVQKFSCHYEADFDRGGASVLDIRPLLWKDGWLVAGDNLKDGTYEIQSVRAGTALELAGEAGAAGNLDTRLANYTRQTQQRWAITALTNAGGYPGSPYFKITVAGTDRALVATADAKLVTVPSFTGAPEQVWRLDQLTDGTWRIMPKAVPNSKDALALSAGSGGSPTLAKFDPASDTQRWRLPALWKDGSPVASEIVKDGTYEIESVRTGTALELAVEGVPVGGGRAGRGMGGGGMRGGGAGGGRGGAGGAPGGFGGGAGPGAAVAPRTTGEPIVMVGAGDPAGAGDAAGAGAVGGRGARGGGLGGMGGGGMFGGGGRSRVADQDATQVSTNWPAGNIDIRMANYLCQAQQKWAITAMPSASDLGTTYYKITIAGTDRALAAIADRELVSLPAFTGGPEQLWRIEHLTDGTWQISPKSVPGSSESLSLSAVGASFATLNKFDPASDKQRWLIKTP
jgi:arabinan endo-1,5-alpha-L-arabinosidase